MRGRLVRFRLVFRAALAIAKRFVRSSVVEYFITGVSRRTLRTSRSSRSPGSPGSYEDKTKTKTKTFWQSHLRVPPRATPLDLAGLIPQALPTRLCRCTVEGLQVARSGVSGDDQFSRWTPCVMPCG